LARWGAGLAILQAIAHKLGKGDTVKHNPDPFMTFDEAMDLLGMIAAVALLTVLCLMFGGEL